MQKISRRRFIAGAIGAGVLVSVVQWFRPRRASDLVEGGVKRMGIQIFDYCIEGDDVPPDQETCNTRYSKGKFSMAIAQPVQFKNRYDVPGGIKSVNPNLVMAMYINGSHISGPPATIAAMPDSWFVKDSSGDRVMSAAFSNNYLMNPRSTANFTDPTLGVCAGWKDWVAKKAHHDLVDCRYSAIYIDELGVGPITTVSGGPPIDASNTGGDGKVWTWGNWISQCIAIINAVKAANSGVPVYINGLGLGARYYEAPLGIAPSGGATSRLLAPATAALAESFMRGSSQAIDYYPSTKFSSAMGMSAYEREIKMIGDSGSKAMACSKAWNVGTASDRDRVVKYDLCSFLMTAAAGAKWYSTTAKATRLTPWRTEWAQAKQLGNPLGPKTGTVTGTLTREFEFGTVTVNNKTHVGTITIRSTSGGGGTGPTVVLTATVPDGTEKVQGTISGVDYDAPAAHTLYDARAFTSTAANKDWANSGSPYEAVEIGQDVAKPITWRGGVILGQFPLSTTWNQAHDDSPGYGGGTGIRVYGNGKSGTAPTMTLEYVRMHNVEDGFKPREEADYASAPSASTFLLQKSYFTLIHDDCIENDSFLQGRVFDVLFDGVWTFYSEQAQGGDPSPVLRPGEDPNFYVEKALIRLGQSNAPDPDIGGGKFFKYQPGLHRPVIKDSIFAIDAEPKAGWSSANFPSSTTFSGTNNYLLWLGSGAYGANKPSGFKFQSGSTAHTTWRNARNQWLLDHGYASQGTLAANYDPRTNPTPAPLTKVRYP